MKIGSIHKMQYPTDAISTTTEKTTSGSGLIVSTSTKTILGFQSNQSNIDVHATVKCGNIVIFQNYGGELQTYLSPLSIVCPSAIYYTKTTNNNIFFTLTYVPYDLSKISTTTSTTIGTSTIATSTSISILPTMTAGEILLSTMIFFCLIFAVIYSLAKALWPIQVWIKKKNQ